MLTAVKGGDRKGVQSDLLVAVAALLLVGVGFPAFSCTHELSTWLIHVLILRLQKNKIGIRWEREN